MIESLMNTEYHNAACAYQAADDAVKAAMDRLADVEHLKREARRNLERVRCEFLAASGGFIDPYVEEFMDAQRLVGSLEPR